MSVLLAALNRGGGRLSRLPLFVALIGFASCADQDNPIGPSSPAGKANVDADADQSLIISWACDTAVDPVWTIFYGSDYRFQIQGEEVLFSHYLSDTKRTEYITSELLIPQRVRAVFRSGGGACGLYSDALDDVEAVVRIYRGAVHHWYRGTADARYVLSADDVEYPIAFVAGDGSVRHRDFYALHNRNAPRPAGLVEIRSATRLSAYYLPINFKLDALDALSSLPADDRPYLANPICSGDACAEWVALVPSTPVDPVDSAPPAPDAPVDSAPPAPEPSTVPVSFNPEPSTNPPDQDPLTDPDENGLTAVALIIQAPPESYSPVQYQQQQQAPNSPTTGHPSIGRYEILSADGCDRQSGWEAGQGNIDDANGITSITYQWYKNGTAIISGCDGASQRIQIYPSCSRDRTVGDPGNYYLIATVTDNLGNVETRRSNTIVVMAGN